MIVPFSLSGPYADKDPLFESTVPMTNVVTLAGGAANRPASAAAWTRTTTTRIAITTHKILLLPPAFAGSGAGACCSSIITPGDMFWGGFKHSGAVAILTKSYANHRTRCRNQSRGLS